MQMQLIIHGRQETKLHSLYLIFLISFVSEFVSFMLFTLNNYAFFIAISY